MFNLNELKIIREALHSKMCDVSFLRFFGGSIGDAACDLLDELIVICDRIDIHIGYADVEANSQDSVADFTKCTVSDLDQRSAGNEVSLDQHLQLYREVF